MTDEEIKLRGLQLLKDNLEVYSAHCLKVKTKNGAIVPFMWNRAQRFIHAALEEQRARMGFVRAIILKGRQQGCSTLIGARFYHRTTMNHGQSAFIVTHEQKATDNLYDMVRRYHDHNPAPVSTGATNAKELVFDKLDGGYKLATAGTKDVGRSNTAQLLHGCLGAGAMVMMADGSLRAIETLEPGDLVRTRRGFEAPVKGISWHKDSTRELRIAMNGLRLRATDSHKFWTRRGMVALADLRVGDELGFPVRQITEEVSTVRFARDLSVRAQGGGRCEARGPEAMPLTFELGRMLGLYLAEGHVALQSKAPHEPGSVVFACHERELERNTSWVRAVGGYSSLSERANKGSKTRMTVAYGRQFASFVLRMCGRNGGKHLPHEWWRMPREFVRGLLVGYLAGDGHCSAERDRRIQAPSIVPAIAYGMRDVVAALGYGFPSVRFREAAQRAGRNEKAQYTLRITGSAVDAIAPMLGWNMPARRRAVRDHRVDGGYAWLAIESIGERIEEMVWDIEVDHPDHDYCLTQCATSNSEFAFWSNAQSHLAGIGNTIVDAPPTEIILESTGNGLGNAFHLMWQDAEQGKGLYIPIFVPWYWQDEYRAKVRDDFKLTPEDVVYRDSYGLDMEQMQWRANKITSYGEGFAWLFDQEYPATAALAFQTGTLNPLVSPHYVSAAAKGDFYDENGPLIIGCDPASDGAGTVDRTCIVFRRGRVVFRVEYHEKLNSMQVAGKLAGYWAEFAPDAIFVDKGGIGTGIVDRLQELHIPVIGVMFGEAASEPDIYANKKAEMWWRMKDWFEEKPNRIVNNPAFISDICAPQPDVSSNGRKLLESKQKLEKRQIRSPDGGDALALTFAEKVMSRAAMAGHSRGSYETPSKAGY